MTDDDNADPFAHARRARDPPERAFRIPTLLNRPKCLLGLTLSVMVLGLMPKTTQTTVSQNDNGQYQVTIPKALGDALGLAGMRVAWAVESSDSLKLTRVDD